MMERIIKAHYPGLEETLIGGVLDAFYRIQELKGLQKKPGTSEILDWIQALNIGGIPVEVLERKFLCRRSFEENGGFKTSGEPICSLIFYIFCAGTG